MKERPILFSGPMVRAILDERKTQTRRVVKNTGLYAIDAAIHGPEVAARELIALATRCPYGAPGDRLWVRETFLNNALPGYPPVWFYRADGNDKPHDRNWKPSIFCTREASRITLEIVSVRVERLNGISEEDAKAEGIDAVRDEWSGQCGDFDETLTDQYLYQVLWESINGPGSWETNPWVWVVEFRQV